MLPGVWKYELDMILNFVLPASSGWIDNGWLHPVAHRSQLGRDWFLLKTGHRPAGLYTILYSKHHTVNPGLYHAAVI